VKFPGLSVVAEGLRTRYGNAVAVNCIDLAVPERTVCGLRGPNGAGGSSCR
jgi:ABC-type multidrug transport system ATPase subunit